MTHDNLTIMQQNRSELRRWRAPLLAAAAIRDAVSAIAPSGARMRTR